MNFASAFTLTIIFAFSINSIVECANLKVGEIGPNDVLLYQAKVKRPVSRLGYITSENVQYPGLGGIKSEKTAIITAVNIIDNTNDESFASIVSGGPGQYNVLIYFESQNGKGYDFDLEIYGHYVN